MTATITSFDGKYSFLSNFAQSNVVVLIGTKWVRVPTVEHGYQASKTLSQHWRRKIAECETPGQAKRMGQKVMRASYWEEVKTIIMLELLRQKFSRVKMRDALLRTGDAKLIEGNHWHDNFWGICSCDDCAERFAEEQANGNWLGRLLMRVRKDIQ